ncbi:MAG: sulfotransferase family protein [Okeania sp. SIO2F4]|uniref:sulfotransferase family 2 domain-containing protein n=1 Tax=Okeania sp. SIO2F4 TaxID=2607790 RepID=UPI001429A62D|nr:sulfotransferase family 2 domain-containing protein [Okeania sp. SIO2F4]NES02283.1 sulfotransferase family protein [Okeania sp. SIO2F4]
MKKQRIIKLKRFKIAYFPIPKCACTSLKLLCYYLEGKHKFPIKKIKLQRKFKFLFYPKFIFHPKIVTENDVHDFWGYQREEINPYLLAEYFKFTVVRDPVKRFISAYKNRILFHQDIKNSKFVKVNIQELGLQEYPEVNFFVQNLKEYMKLSRQIDIHFSSQSNHLMNDLGFYDFVCPIEDMENLRSKLSQIVGTKIDIPKTQTGGSPITLKDLTEESLSKLIEFYAEDYELLQDYYSVDVIKAEFERVRNL